MDPVVREALAVTLRRHRLARSMTQGALGHPLTRAYVSSVESGRTVPSLPALRLMVMRLDMTLAEFFTEVDAAASSPT
jgi:transcriptional regulator with XRE-family HTH domain